MIAIFWDAKVRLRFGGGTVRAVPVFGSGGSSAKGCSVLQCSFTGKDRSGTVLAVPVALSVSGKNGSYGSSFRFRFCSCTLNFP